MVSEFSSGETLLDCLREGLRDNATQVLYRSAYSKYKIEMFMET